ncbi:hypothetical protein CLI92_06590 [Vandammella animalimorsus]|uniref:RES domain-containing protein n=1 Tax=Vandammella animalimorsus TaxID=2029117 RepID=A0A2A2ATH9_9BURK|nr:RES family NAD+ phosphorylase [Vandammella animalimorsus]PAT30890.1 hypothetical protein CK626_12890 [Vandammella animalimorsus]PAT41057.1 hypothetical protein CK621_13165 [Vandammella animalimorsus]PAX16779.1 hypothetical protein CLI92_06590 [Vandammella animalimorsus]PAX20423.1 hypothetical protein CLI93_01320 [Vandammella animalimorsus]
MHDWPSFQIQAGELLQHVSRTAYRHTPLHFGRNAANRYDDPARGYGVLYLGFELATALMESVFHKHLWLEAPSRAITLQEVRQRMVRVIEVMANIHLADFTAPGFMASGLGMNLAQLACRDYAHTQRLSAQVHALQGCNGQPLFDGVLYPSRNNYPAKSIALFDRAAAKLRVDDDIDLDMHRDWPDFVKAYRIGIQDI